MTEPQASEALALLSDIRKNQLESIALQREALAHARESWQFSKQAQRNVVRLQRIAVGVVVTLVLVLVIYLTTRAFLPSANS